MILSQSKTHRELGSWKQENKNPTYLLYTTVDHLVIEFIF